MILFKMPRAVAPFKMPKPVAPFKKSQAAMLQHLLGIGAGVRGGTLHGDNFNDNSRDVTFWDLLQVVPNPTVVAEQNQRLEFSWNGVWPANPGGYVTVNSHNLAESDIQVQSAQPFSDPIHVLMVCLTKVTATNPWIEADYYALIRYDRNQWQVHQQIAGVHAQWNFGSGVVNPDPLRLLITGGNISFYGSGGAFLSTLAWGLASYNCYVYIYATPGGPGTNVDMGYYDDFLASN